MEPTQVTFPDLFDLQERVRFAPMEGRIWLDKYRMLLLHVEAFASFRAELIHSLGVNKARTLLTRMGYVAGARDAELARRVRPGESEMAAFAVGPQLHALEGIVFVQPVDVRMDVAKGEYYGEFIWRDSSEDDAHISQFGIGAEPACWMQIGYACGYTTAFMGKSILYREVECRSQGREHCRIVGKPASEWKHAEEDLKYLQFGKIETLHVPGQPAAAPPEPAPKVGNGGGPAIPKPGRGKIVGASTGYVVARHKLERVAATKATVLFSGETGVGKERFARLLHDLSPRRAKPFIAMNCAAIPYDLVESELFGVVKGAYTGAIQDRPGRFERADGGTLFLDEIGALPYAAQAKLLRALQEKEIERLGGVTVHKVDVRIAAATNVDLEVEMRAGRFRADLYHRLNVFPIVLPSLKERRDDIPLLLEHFLQIFCAEHNKLVTGFTGQAMDVLLSYDYPGNIRELENLVERAVILVDDGCPIDRYHLLESGHMLRDLVVRLSREGRMTQAARGDGANGGNGKNGAPAPGDDLSKLILESGVSFPSLEQTVLKAAVSRAGGNLSEAARAMGISRAQLAYRLEKRVANGLGGGKDANCSMKRSMKQGQED